MTRNKSNKIPFVFDKKKELIFIESKSLVFVDNMGLFKNNCILDKSDISSHHCVNSSHHFKL